MVMLWKSQETNIGALDDFCTYKYKPIMMGEGAANIVHPYL